jgi:hypothetical protein
MNFKRTIMDKNGCVLKPGDKVHDKWGFDLTVHYTDAMGWYGMLICEDNHSCKNIPYALNSEDIEKIE